MADFTSLVITRDDSRAETRSVPPELVGFLHEVGFDLGAVNTMRWPIGASRHATLTVLMTAADVDAVIGGNIRDPVEVVMGELIFDRMFVVNLRPIIPSEASGALYLVDLVDERYFFNGGSSDDLVDPLAFNQSTSDKSNVYDVTEDPGTGFDWRPKAVLPAIWQMLEGALADLDVPEDIVELENNGMIRDVNIQGLPAAEWFDRVCASAGCVLVAFPNTSWGVSTRRYQVQLISSGMGHAHHNLTTFNNDLMAGGLYGVDADFPTINIGAAKFATNHPKALEAIVPSEVRVLFPLHPAPSIQPLWDNETATLLDDGFDYALERWWGITTDFGKPNGIDGNASPRILHADLPALWTEPGDIVGDLSTVANKIAEHYYRRFKSGAGDMIFRGILKVRPHSGAQVVEWRMLAAGPVTRLRGQFDCPLFGFATDQPLTANDILANGTVRATPRQGGGLLIDSPASYQNLMLGEITAVYGASNATYDAVALGNPLIEAFAATPMNRHFASPVAYLPATVGALCLLVRPVPFDNVYIYHLNEMVDTDPACP